MTQGPNRVMDHFNHYMCHSMTNEEIENKDHKVAQLVCGKLNEFLGEFESAYNDEGKWSEWQAMEIAGCDEQESVHPGDFIECAVLFHLHTMAAFVRRVAIPLHQCQTLLLDKKLLWLAHSPMDEFCPRRRHVAVLILDTPDHELEVTAAKIKIIAFDDVYQAAMTGKCGKFLYLLVKAFRISFKADVQCIEGVNSMIRCISTRCRRIGLALLSARVLLKKALGLGTKTSPTKWSSIRDRATDVLRVCTSNYDHGVYHMLGKQGRWKPIQAGEDGGVLVLKETDAERIYKRDVDPKGGQPGLAWMWAVQFNLKWHREHPKPSVKHCIGFEREGDTHIPYDGMSVYLNVDKSYSLGMAVQCEISEGRDEYADGPIWIVRPLRPFRCSPSVEIISEFYEHCHDEVSGGPVNMHSFKLCWALDRLPYATVVEQISEGSPPAMSKILCTLNKKVRKRRTPKPKETSNEADASGGDPAESSHGHLPLALEAIPEEEEE
eukprot:12420957-Karenia_brevis.AAC.4